MKALIIAFTTALLVFAVSWAILEMLKLGDASPTSSLDRARLKASNAELGKDKSKSATSKRKRSDPQSDESEAAGDSDFTQKRDSERQNSAMRQREADLRDRQLALDIILEDIRAVQSSVKQIQRQLSLEIAEQFDATINLARRDRQVPVVATGSPSNRNSETANRSSTIDLTDGRAIRDITVLVRRLVEQDSLSAAALLLGEMKERDASKVLDSIAETDRGIAVRLSEILLAGRAGNRELR